MAVLQVYLYVVLTTVFSLSSEHLPRQNLVVLFMMKVETLEIHFHLKKSRCCRKGLDKNASASASGFHCSGFRFSRLSHVCNTHTYTHTYNLIHTYIHSYIHCHASTHTNPHTYMIEKSASFSCQGMSLSFFGYPLNVKKGKFTTSFEIHH